VDGDVVTAADCELRVIGTPAPLRGFPQPAAFADAALLTGTPCSRRHHVIASRGSLADYLRSLDAMKALADTASVRVLLPGHGPVVSDPGSTLVYYIEHRAERLAEVRAPSPQATRRPSRSWPACTTTSTPPCAGLLSCPCRRSWTTWPPPAKSARSPSRVSGRACAALAGALAQALAVDDQHRTC